MDDDGLAWLPGHRIRKLYLRGELSPVEVARHFLDRVAALDDTLHAFRTIDEDDVLDQARLAEVTLGGDEPLGPLFGIPVSVKDTLDTAGLRTTYGSLVYRDHVPARDAAAVERLRAAGAIVFGKTNTPEFATIGHTINRLGPQTSNPWDPTRTPAGSSGGAGASVAAGLCPLALGTDAGGSIRYPAAFNGVFGLFPGSARVPRTGNVEANAFGYPVGGIGPITRDVRDAAVVFAAIAGWHPGDPLMSRQPVPDVVTSLDEGVAGVRMGWLDPPAGTERDPKAYDVIRSAAARFTGLGAHVDEVRLDTSDVLDLVAALMLCAVEPLRRLAADPVTREMLTPAVLAFGSSEPPDADGERQAWAARRTFIDRVDAALADVDLVLSPTAAFVAPMCPSTPFENFLPYESYTRVPMLANLAGRPSASIPCGFVDGLPLGLMLIGRRGREDVLFRAARAFEAAYPWGDTRPLVH